jgi:hypothetical protein
MRSASEKRQGTKSREVWRRLCSASYGDFTPAPTSMVDVTLAGCGDAARRGRERTKASRREVGARSRVLTALMAVIGSKGIAAGVGPAYRNGKAARPTGDLAHDVSILAGVGRHLGSQPRANTSITIMRAPQRGSIRSRNLTSSHPDLDAISSNY